MEVKPGYKQTEVGIIPKTWDAPLLGELFTFKNGLNKAKEFFGYGTPIVNYMDVYGRRGIYAKELEGRVSLSKQELKAFDVRKGDVFFTRTSETAAEVGITSVMLDESHDTVFSGFVLRARPRDNSLDDQFKKYCFSTNFVRDQIVSQTTETTRALTNGRYLSTVAIARPPLPEQRAIAEALGDVDALIHALEKLTAKKRDLKQAAMQQLLTGQKRLPGFHGEWEVRRVLELGEVVTGGTPRTDVQAYWGDGYPWITPTDISTYRDMFTSERTLTQKGLNAIRALPANTVLVTCIASIGKNAILKTAGGCNQQINAVTPNKNNSAEFLYYVFEASKQYLLANAGTTATSIISKAAFEQLIFKVPSLPEQTAIAGVLSDMDAEIAALEQRLAKTRALKQGMMQELLTGRVWLI